MSKADTIKRWDSFLSRIKERCHELFEPARQQGLAMFIESGNDPIPMANALNSIRLQMLELCRKADDSWDEKVRDMMYNAGVRDGDLDKEEFKRGRTRHELEVEYALLEADIRYQMARQIEKLAKETQVKAISCTQCLAQLEVSPNIYKAAHITCKFCQTVNTYEPGTYYRMWGGFLPDVAKWNVREDMVKEMNARHLIQEAPESTREKVKSAHRATFKAYLEKYLAELKALNPDIDIEKEFNLQMRSLDN